MYGRQLADPGQDLNAPGNTPDAPDERNSHLCIIIYVREWSRKYRSEGQACRHSLAIWKPR
jgi:hypothetical protein